MTDCHVLKMPPADGRQGLTDVADTGNSSASFNPSPNAEPFKLSFGSSG